MSHYIPLTGADEARMLETLGIAHAEALFDSIPESIREAAAFRCVPEQPECEPAIQARLARLAGLNMSCDAVRDGRQVACFLGGGVYDHFVPAAVRHLAMRSEFYTAYTPYQPEVAQGTLQAIFEYQSLIATLTGMDISNASHYDGGAALAEAALMSLAATGKDEVLVSAGVSPRHRAVLATYLEASGARLSLLEIGQDGRTRVPPPALLESAGALIVASPNALGVIEDLAAIAAARGPALLVVVAYPISLGLLKPPGAFGADIVVGDGINLGGGLSFGGPGLGFIAVKEKLLRRMPGRLCGQTVDVDGKTGYVLTIQAREQHIRREKASSNICTNQALLALHATIYMSLMGKTGFRHLAQLNFTRAHELQRKLENAGIPPLTRAPFFNEFAVRLPGPAAPFLARAAAEGILAGRPLDLDYPAHRDALLVAVTEKRTPEEIDRYVALAREHFALR